MYLVHTTDSGQDAGMRLWFTTALAAEYAGLHPVTVRKACESGSMHGVQRVKGGRWRIHVVCLDAWIEGRPCPHEAGEAAK